MTIASGTDCAISRTSSAEMQFPVGLFGDAIKINRVFSPAAEIKSLTEMLKSLSRVKYFGLPPAIFTSDSYSEKVGTGIIASSPSAIKILTSVSRTPSTPAPMTMFSFSIPVYTASLSLSSSSVLSQGYTLKGNSPSFMLSNISVSTFGLGPSGFSFELSFIEPFTNLPGLYSSSSFNAGRMGTCIIIIVFVCYV